jgi:hypothetical protein
MDFSLNPPLVAVDGDQSTTLLFTTPKLEPGAEEEGQYGWQFGCNAELPAVAALPGRVGSLDLVHHDLIFSPQILKDKVIGRATIDLFKFHFKEAFDINDGVWKVPLRLLPTAFSSLDTIPQNAFIGIIIYKPKFGTPPLQKFTLKLITPETTPEMYLFTPWTPADFIPTPVPTTPINISLDAIRFLPVNVTVLRVHVRLFSLSRGKYVILIDLHTYI